MSSTGKSEGDDHSNLFEHGYHVRNRLMPWTLLEDLKNLAGSIEDELYKVNGEKVSQAYKESVRSHVFNLKDTSNPLRQKVLSGEIVPKEFAVMVSKASR